MPLDLQRTLLWEMEDAVAGSGSASVVDLTDNAPLFRYESERPRIMASTTKIFTAGAVLEALGPDATLPTRLVSDSEPDADGTLNGDLYVIGGGDPTLGDAQHVKSILGDTGTTVEDIIQQVRVAGIQRIEGAVIGDGSLLKPEPGTKITTAGLTFNRTTNDHPVQFAAEKITEGLKHAGVPVSQEPQDGTAPQHFKNEIGRANSPSLLNILKIMGHESDNFLAESMTRLVAAGRTRTTSVRNGAALIQEYAKKHGANIEIANGSGLGIQNLASTSAITAYLASAALVDYSSELIRTLPQAGKEGTLRLRMRNTLASECIRAKTGTLTRAKKPAQDSLAGYAFGTSRTLAFSIVRERSDSRYASRASIDRMAEAIAWYSNR